MIKKYPLYYNLDTGGGADVSGVTATAEDVDTGKVFVDNTGAEVTGTSTTKTDLIKIIEQPENASVSIPYGVTTIKGGFKNFYNLVSVSIPDTVTSLGYEAFFQCGSLGLTTLPDTITNIGWYAFYYCLNFNTPKLPNTLQTIGQQAFTYCTALTITSIPSSVTGIDNYAFSGCTGLTTITFEGQPTFIETNAFAYCTNLTTIQVPWGQDEVADAPWGAVNASIIYG